MNMKQRMVPRLLWRVVPVLLLLALLLPALASCGGGYSPVESSEEEARVIAELGDFDVRYELFYAFFHAERAAFDGGDDSLWQGESAASLWESVSRAALLRIAEIYATFSVCLAHGIDPYGDEIDDQVDERVEIDIDGGVLGESIVMGYGSKEAYLSALAEMHLNDSVNRLLHRYDVATEQLYDRVIENFDGGENTVTDEELRAFFLSDDCRRITWVFRSYDNVLGIGEEQNERLLGLAEAELKNAIGYSDVKAAVVKYCSPSLSNDEIENGIYISRFSGLDASQRKMIDVAFSLGNMDVSDRIATPDGVYILVGLRKHGVDSDYFESHREMLYDLCLESRLFAEIEELRDEMLADILYTDVFGSLLPGELMAPKA